MSMTTDETKSVIEDAGLKFEDFVEWMDGQTIGMYPDGSTNWYVWDVDRYVRGKRVVHD